MKYRGYTYFEDIQEDDDVRKIFHEIIDPEGRMVNWQLVPDAFHQISPYQSATREQFESAVDEVIFRKFTFEYCGS